MKIEIKETKTHNVVEMRVVAKVRYWEDAEVNGQEDNNGALIPCRDGETWCPIINIDTGQITNWQKGVVADIHYKVCDQCSFSLIDKSGEAVYYQEGDYVPNVLCPKDSGYGDYIIMDVDAEGFIQDWDADSILEIFGED
jgi:hypothetical protein